MIKLDVDPVKKVFFVRTSGMVSFDEAKDYINDLEAKIKTVDPSQYSLIIDAREQKAVSPDTVQLLEKALNIYSSTPFAKRYSVVLESTIAMSQIKRVGKGVDLFTMVTSIEDALKDI
jgi:hypothetical protein